MANDKNKLWSIRHTAEHVLTKAMINLYGEENIIFAMGPATDEGFYFDFDHPENFKISEEDFLKIETEMQKIIDENLQMTKKVISKDEAEKLFAKNSYKLEWIKEISEKGDELTVYELGNEKDKNYFIDLCSGPHANSTGEISAFKLLSVAGAYWRGNEKNKMLTRIYGTAFESKEELDSYVNMIEEAKKRDHRKLGKELDLFTFSDLVGGGLALWTPKGTIIRNELNDFVWELRKARGYQRVTIPHITKKDLYETSGHWAKFSEELFKITTREGHEFAMKPMNCPHHTQIFAHLQRSYKDMPQRYAETTMVYRDEQSGELSGLSRVRCITQDDAHVFCRKNQIKEEFFKVWDIVDNFYKTFGFELKVRLSFHDPENFEAYLGTKEIWKEAEDSLEQIAKERGSDFFIAKGEAAMYGPKIDFMGKDALGRDHQVATIQLDMNMPERFDLFCINESGEKERIVMLHCAIMGSIERFSSVMIEHFAGAFPVWLSPVQVKVLPISDKFNIYATEVDEFLQKIGEQIGIDVRCEIDDRAERIQAKIRDAEMQKIPYILVVGAKEESNKSVAVRARGKGDIGSMGIEEFAKVLIEKIKERSLDV
ncbi:MAG: threonine--tRNA ligase [Patescibacteria group bacterium]